MQEVYKDGSLGKEREFNKDEMLEALQKNKQIDHFRVFEKETGNNVDEIEVLEKKIEEIIDKKIDEKLTEQEKKNNLFKGFEMLKKEFDKKRRF